MKKLLVILSLLVPVATLLAILAFASSVAAAAPDSVPRTDPHKELVVSRGAAENSLRATLGSYAGPIAYVGTKDRPGVRTYEFKGTDFHALVDVSDGHVALLTRALDVPDGTLKLTSQEAQDIAVAYLHKIQSPIDGLEIKVWPMTGGGFPGYTVMFQRYADGALLPDYRTVEVDGIAGRVVSLVDIRRPTTPTHPARVAKSEAIKNASAHGALLATEQMQDATLIVSFDQAGNQLELWEVKLAPATDTDPGSVVYVDADTGSVVDPLK